MWTFSLILFSLGIFCVHDIGPSLPGFLFSGRFASVGVNHHRLCSAVFQFTETPNGELPGLVFSPEILNSI